MAFKSTDGKSFGNRQKMAAYDSRQKPAAEPMAEGEPGGGDIHEMVANHGPAEKIEITTHHGGKKHHSVHSNAQEAHEHISAATGEEHGGGMATMGGGAEDCGVM